jgi:spore coat protein CotH
VMGVPSPRSVHARLIINGKYSGLYALTEQVDGPFAKHNFADGGGNVYKEVWPLNMNNKPHSTQTYKNALKTNEDLNPSVDIIKSFAQRIAEAEPSELQQVIAASMEINEVISLIVVDRMIRNDDGPFHWYCENGNCSNHNYYWYEEPNNQKLHLIPWDLDNAFENIITNTNPVTPIADSLGKTTSNSQPFGYGFLQIQQRSAACDKLTGGWASFVEEYEQLRSQFKEGPFSEAQVVALLDSWSEQIRAATLEASQTHSDALSFKDWENAMLKLKNQLEFARNN